MCIVRVEKGKVVDGSLAAFSSVSVEAKNRSKEGKKRDSGGEEEEGGGGGD